VIDYEPYQIDKLVELLEDKKEISQIFFCEEDLAGNIDQWMLDTVQNSQLVLFIATQKSVFNSPDCQNELELANKFSIPVIPLKGDDIDWKALEEKNLSRELGLEYNKADIYSFSTELYNYILSYKREIDLMSKETRKQGLTDIYERFRLIMDEKLSGVYNKIEKLEERLKKFEN
jgi:hypothetical protein